MFSFMKSLALIGAAALTFVPLACQARETQETPASGAAPQVPAMRRRRQRQSRRRQFHQLRFQHNLGP